MNEYEQYIRGRVAEGWCDVCGKQEPMTLKNVMFLHDTWCQACIEQWAKETEAAVMAIEAGKQATTAQD